MGGIDPARRRPPGGCAGGDLTGNYPNPQIGLDKVGSAEIATGAIGSSELGALSVGALALKGATAVVGTGVAVGVNETKTAPGRPLSGPIRG